MKKDFGGNGGTPWVTTEEFQKTLAQMGAQLGKDEKTRVEKFNELVAALNKLNDLMTQFGQAQNLTAEIVDSLRLHVEFLQEKAGGGFVDELGMFTETEEFKVWCQKRIDRVQAADALQEKPAS